MMLTGGNIALLLLSILVVAESRLYQHILLSEQRIGYSHQALMRAWQELIKVSGTANIGQIESLFVEKFRVEHRFLLREQDCLLHQVEVSGPLGSHAQLQELNCARDLSRKNKKK